MAYTRLLRAYYRAERPIAADQAYRLSRASSKSQRAAVDTVLAEFFELRADGWHNKRADEEIAAYQAQADTNRRIANNRKGKRTVDESLHEPSHESSTKGTPNQNQIPEPDNSKALSGKPDHAPRIDKLNGYRQQATEILRFLNEKTGRAYRPVDATLRPIVARLREGYCADDIRAVVANKCRQWSGDEKMNTYLRPKTLFGAENFANYEGALSAGAPQKKVAL